MRIFLIINLFIVIIRSYEYRINNNCAWPDDCYITMQFTETCAIKSATIQPANRSKPTEETIRKMNDAYHHDFQCIGFRKESMIRCYNRCHRGPIKNILEIPENHMYQYTSPYFEKNIEKYKNLSVSSDTRVNDFGYGKVQETDKNEEYKFWKDCVFKGLNDSTSILTNKESKAAVKLDLKCGQSDTFCRFIIEYTLDGIKSITSEKYKHINNMIKNGFYHHNAYSCRIFEKTIVCICYRKNIRCQSFDHLIESIYLLGRDKVIRGEYPEQEDRNEKEYYENIPKVLEMLQKFRTDYPKDMYGSTHLDCSSSQSGEEHLCSGSCYLQFKIRNDCDNSPFQSKVQFRDFISPHRFVDADRTGSIAVEIKHEYGNLNMNVYCKMGCVFDYDSLYASIMDVLRRQMETREDIIRFISSDKTDENKEEYLACVYYSLRNTFLNRMYYTYDVPDEQPEAVREIPKRNEILPLIISTILASIIVVLILSIMVIGTISYFRSQTKKEQPITFSKKTVIARRKKPIGKSAEFVNSKDKSGDFYDCVSKTTSPMNNTDLASTVEETKSRD